MEFFETKPSKTTVDFFNDMLTRMPDTMKKDKDVQKTVGSLREKMK